MYFIHSPLLFLESLGTGEVLLIVFVIIIFFGGKKIPEVARVLGKGMREFKAAADNIQGEIQKSVNEIERNTNVEKAIKDLDLEHNQPAPVLIRDEAEHPSVAPLTPATPVTPVHKEEEKGK
ncbi:MAG: twin-arginine translocase TatA/TatE family subunit [Bacteroidia bacterium]